MELPPHPVGQGLARDAHVKLREQAACRRDGGRRAPLLGHEYRGVLQRTLRIESTCFRRSASSRCASPCGAAVAVVGAAAVAPGMPMLRAATGPEMPASRRDFVRSAGRSRGAGALAEPSASRPALSSLLASAAGSLRACSGVPARTGPPSPDCAAAWRGEGLETGPSSSDDDSLSLSTTRP